MYDKSVKVSDYDSTATTSYADAAWRTTDAWRRLRDLIKQFESALVIPNEIRWVCCYSFLIKG